MHVSHSKIQLLNDVCSTCTRTSHLLIVGDFNFKEIKWGVIDITVNKNHVASVFLEAVKDTYLFFNMQKRLPDIEPIPDLVLTDRVSDLEYLPGLCKSDHVGLNITYNCFIEVTFKNLPN